MVFSKRFMKDERKNRDQGNISGPGADKYNTTDPEERMEGPVSSSMKKIGESFDTSESKEEADEEKDKKM
jgi:hypothetical protein